MWHQIKPSRRMRLCRNKRKQLQNSHTGESWYPEATEITGFRVAHRWNIIRHMLDRMTKTVITTQSGMPGEGIMGMGNKVMNSFIIHPSLTLPRQRGREFPDFLRFYQLCVTKIYLQQAGCVNIDTLLTGDGK